MLDWNEVVEAFPRSARKHLRKPYNWDQTPNLVNGYRMWLGQGVYKGYLLEDISGKLFGWELLFDAKARNNKRAEMCDLCKFVHGGTSCGVAFFSIQSSKNRSIGLYICRDLDCEKRCSETGVNAMRESLTQQEKKERLEKNILDIIVRLHTESDRT